MLPQYAPLQIEAARQHAIRRARMQMAARFDKPAPKRLPPVALSPMREPEPERAPPPPRDILFIASAPDDLPLSDGNQPAFSVRGIIKTLAYARSIPVEAICSPRRTADLVKIRQDAMFIAWSLTIQSLPELGRRFGGRDHTTVLHAVRKRSKEFGIFGLPDIRERAKQIAKGMLFDASNQIDADNAGRGY